MAVTAIDHVLVLSDDIDATRDFYRDVVGLRVGARPPLQFPGYWLYADGPSACLHVADREIYLQHAAGLGLMPPAVSHGGGAVDHVAFDADDFDELRDRIEGHGIAAVHNQVPDGPRQIFIEDPNGVRVELNVKASR